MTREQCIDPTNAWLVASAPVRRGSNARAYERLLGGDVAYPEVSRVRLAQDSVVRHPSDSARQSRALSTYLGQFKLAFEPASWLGARASISACISAPAH